MAIDREKLLKDWTYWFPKKSGLTEEEFIYISDLIIAEVGDDASNHAEILCKCLEACALKVLTTKDPGSGTVIKRRKVGQREDEYFQGGFQEFWENYIKSLSKICPVFGYTPPFLGMGIEITPGDKFKVLCEDDEANLYGDLML